jgi:hypothetical protein
MKRIATAFVLSVVVALSAACASMPAKQRAQVTLTSVETAVAALQDFERANYAQMNENVPAPQQLRKFCPASALPAPLPENATIHQVVSCLFAQVFNSQITSSKALLNYNATGAPPTALGALRGQVDTLFDIIKGLSNNANQQQALALAKSTVDSVLSVINLVGGNIAAVTPGGTN